MSKTAQVLIEEEIALELNELEKLFDAAQLKHFYVVHFNSAQQENNLFDILASSSKELIENYLKNVFTLTEIVQSEFVDGLIIIRETADEFLAVYSDFSQAEKKVQQFAANSNLEVKVIKVNSQKEIDPMSKKDRKNMKATAVEMIEESEDRMEDETMEAEEHIDDEMVEESEDRMEDDEMVEEEVVAEDESSEESTTKAADEVTISEACEIVHRQEMWVKKQCRDKFEKEGTARKEGGQWLIKRNRLEELSNEIEVYNMTLEQAAKKSSLTEEEVQSLVDSGKIKGKETEEGFRISKKSLNYYQKETEPETVQS